MRSKSIRRHRLVAAGMAAAIVVAFVGSNVRAAPAIASGRGAPSYVVVAVPPEPGSQLPQPEPSTAESVAEAQSILARLEYQEPPPGLLQRILEWFGQQLGKVFQSGGGAIGGWGVWVVVALLLGAVAFFFSRIQRSGRFGSSDAGYEFDLEDRRPPADWVADAEQFESRGEWKQALRCRFRALVGELIILGALRDLPGRTTGEYRLEIRRFAPDAGSAFAAASVLFEGAWYGDEPTGPQENQQFRTLAATTMETANGAARQKNRDQVAPKSGISV